MDEIFLKILNMSIASSFLILPVIILRLVFKKAPKWIRCVMWSMVGAKLIVPFSFESKLSLIPNAQKLSDTSQSSTSYISDSTVTVTATQNTNIDIIAIVGIIWIIGVLAMLIYMLLSFLKIRKTTRESIHIGDNIWICDRIRSPFVLGFINPKIYLLSSMTEDETKYVVAHEKAHLKRMDNIWKPLGFVLLCVHWFNPLCWIAYWLFNKDIELACDENVIKTLDSKGKKAYSTALLSCSADRHILSACPLAFGENNVKQRIKSVLSYKKPTVYAITVSITVCVVTAILFMTNPISSAQATSTELNTEPTSTVATVPETTTPETTVAPTEPTVETTPSTAPATEPETTEAIVEESENEEAYVEESYEEESYYEESYYEENNYDDNSNYEEDGKVDIVPFDPYKDLEEEIEAQREEFSSGNYIRGCHYFSNFGYTPPSYNDPNSPDFQIAWDLF